jgi:TIR domain
MSIYELAIFGHVSKPHRHTLTETIGRMVAQFGLTMGAEVRLLDDSNIRHRDFRAAFAAAYFGGPTSTGFPTLNDLLRDSTPIIPVLPVGGDFRRDIPLQLAASNGLKLAPNDTSLTELATALLECVGLLRRQRRVFISYRRIESKIAAMQLHDVLSARGFDVFLDTHDIRPGDPFQDVLWSRLVDSDVMVMLDTPTYFESKWTRQEIGRARAKEIQVLRVVWPAHTPNKLTEMSETIYLEPNDLSGADGPISDEITGRIALLVESLRSRSIASRYRSITGKLRADIEMIGASIEGIGAHRAISIRLLDDSHVWAYPVVGVPTADLFHDIAAKAQRAEQAAVPILVYDHVGIRDTWATHLQWLDENIKSVRAIKVHEAGWRLSAWGE